MTRMPPKSVLVWRYLTGNHLDGKARTNATWLREGTSPKYRCNWWNRKPRLYRALWRDIPTLVLFLELVGFRTAPVFFVGLNLGCLPLLAIYIMDKVKTGEMVTRKVGVDLGEKADNEREIIDEIGVDAIPEAKGESSRIARLNRKKRKSA